MRSANHVWALYLPVRNAVTPKRCHRDDGREVFERSLERGRVHLRREMDAPGKLEGLNQSQKLRQNLFSDLLQSSVIRLPPDLEAQRLSRHSVRQPGDPSVSKVEMAPWDRISGRSTCVHRAEPGSQKIALNGGQPQLLIVVSSIVWALKIWAMKFGSIGSGGSSPPKVLAPSSPFPFRFGLSAAHTSSTTLWGDMQEPWP